MPADLPQGTRRMLATDIDLTNGNWETEPAETGWDEAFHAKTDPATVTIVNKEGSAVALSLAVCSKVNIKWQGDILRVKIDPA